MLRSDTAFEITGTMETNLGTSSTYASDLEKKKHDPQGYGLWTNLNLLRLFHAFFSPASFSIIVVMERYTSK